MLNVTGVLIPEQGSVSLPTIKMTAGLVTPESDLALVEYLTSPTHAGTWQTTKEIMERKTLMRCVTFLFNRKSDK